MQRDTFSEHSFWIRDWIPREPGLPSTEDRHWDQHEKPLPTILQICLLVRVSGFHLHCPCFQQYLTSQRDMTLKDRAERLQQFHREEASLKGKSCNTAIAQGVVSRSSPIVQRHSFCRRKLQDSFRLHPDRDGTSLSIMVKGKGMKEVRKGGEKGWTYT